MKAGIYIHVPFCAVKCPYCDFYSVRYSAAAVQEYADAVCRNLAALPAGLQADTLYFGGGTPSLLPVRHLDAMIETAAERCRLSEDTEITLEANPLTATAEMLAEWRIAGINRLSLGVQSFDAEILQILGRKHSPEQALAAVYRAADAGFENLSADLILGLRQHTEVLWARELEIVSSLPVTHISPYLLKIEEDTPFGAQPPEMLDDDDAAARWIQMHDTLTERGFLHYEISNFAKPGYQSRHNCKYWKLAPYYGIGPAAHSCHDGKRFAVPRSLRGFCSSPVQPEEVTEPLAETESERIMLGLRLAEGIRPDDLPECREKLLRNAAPLIPEFLEMQGDTLRMTPHGWLLSNAVLTRLMR
ncbi:MAG: radical SAM family heme chaperone HemW [Oscillospiraceae bacterium]|nr:radical SAM family heme chaperone HemW [Oscillospiraceae bacterium]